MTDPRSKSDIREGAMDAAVKWGAKTCAPFFQVMAAAKVFADWLERNSRSVRDRYLHDAISMAVAGESAARVCEHADQMKDWINAG
jgi:hypothetical protein